MKITTHYYAETTKFYHPIRDHLVFFATDKGRSQAIHTMGLNKTIISMLEDGMLIEYNGWYCVNHIEEFPLDEVSKQSLIDTILPDNIPHVILVEKPEKREEIPIFPTLQEEYDD